jgi:hypothetical protein
MGPAGSGTSMLLRLSARLDRVIKAIGMSQRQ